MKLATLRWIDPSPVEVSPALAQAIGGHPLVAQSLVRRGFRDVAAARGFLDPNAYTPAPATDLPDLDLAVSLLQKALATRRRILVWGDFDVDGQTATALLVEVLRQLGGAVDYHIPVRASESHGVNVPTLQSLLKQAPVDILLTCDTGISAHAAIEYAQSLGITVIVTDHHDLSPTLPPATAIINPKRMPADHPLVNLPGVGVAYKLAEELCRRNNRPDLSDAQLDLVALGLVADLAWQQGDTRYLLQRGLPALRQTTRLGLQIMMEMAELNPQNLTEEHISFILAPRLNALGRLADANSSVEFLTTTDSARARILAYELESYNAQRQMLTNQVFAAAQAQIEANPGLLDEPVLILSHPSWPGGVIGIVASRLVESYRRPVILFSTPPGEIARGSARSISGVNITAALAANQHLLAGFGGHPMAAGLSLPAENIPALRRELAKTFQDMPLSTEEESAPLLQLDGYLSLRDLSLDLATDLERLAPFGPGNPPLILATHDLSLSGYAVVGRREEHLLLTLQDEDGHEQRAIWWQGASLLAEQALPEGRFDLAYSLRSATYRGQREIQVEWIAARPVEKQTIVLTSLPPSPEIIDYRHESYPFPMLQRLLAEETPLLWCEGEINEKISREIQCYNRLELTAAPILIIYTIPPSPSELETALQSVQPRKIYLFGVDPGMDQPEPFLRRLAGLVKYHLRTGKNPASLQKLAAATAQRTATVLAGLFWLRDHGYLQIEKQAGNSIWLSSAGVSRQLPSPAAVILKAHLEESAAYRAYYLRAEKERLIGNAKPN